MMVRNAVFGDWVAMLIKFSSVGATSIGLKISHVTLVKVYYPKRNKYTYRPLHKAKKFINFIVELRA